MQNGVFLVWLFDALTDKELEEFRASTANNNIYV